MKTAALTDHLILSVACLTCLVPATRAQNVDIGVRTKVVDKDLQWSHQTAAPEEGGHSKTFGILSVAEIKAEERLVKPVDEKELLRQLFLQLEKNGFREFVKGSKPDILLTLSYGRGSMKNPYVKHLPGESLTPAGDHNEATIQGTEGFQQLFDEKTPGFEANLQKAGFEKLFLRVTAWEYPKDSKAKPKMLWKTIIVAEDPDHQDLNAIAGLMLEAGAPYFDKDLKNDKREINLSKPVPNGHVNVGAPEVVQADPKK